MRILELKQMNKQLLFIHIPKTAGTSFRQAAEKYFGKEHTFYDYTPNSVETSSQIINKIYNAKDPYAFYALLQNHPHSFLSGHFPVVKYTALYETQNVVSFVRDPVSQVISHFNHFKTHSNYKNTIEEFILEPRFQNIQSRMLANKPLSLYGFLGITERYEESIELFNTIYSTEIEVIHTNKKHKEAMNVGELDDELIGKIKKVNAKDIAFYESVCKQFEIRKSLYKDVQLFTYGFIQEVTDTKVKGCAFQNNSNEPVKIEIYHGNNLITTVEAKDYRPGLIKQGVPRRGFVGFEYSWKDDEMDKNEIYCRVYNTQQII